MNRLSIANECWHAIFFLRLEDMNFTNLKIQVKCILEESKTRLQVSIH